MNVAEVSRAINTRQQLTEPWAPITHPAHRVQEWRLFFPFLIYLLHLPRVVYYALPFAGAIGATALSVGTVLARTGSRVLSGAAGGLMATTAWFFVSVGFLAYFDSWLMICLLLAVFWAKPWPLIWIMAIGSFIDERAIIAIPMVWGLRHAGFGPRPSSAKDDAIALAVGTLPYMAFRGGYILAYPDNAVSAYFADEHFRERSVQLMLSGVWHGLRMAWVPIVGMLVCIRPASRRVLAVGGAVTLITSLGVAGDFSRSAAVLAPMSLAGIIFFGRRTRKLVPLFGCLALAVNLVIPAKHVFAIGYTYLRPFKDIREEARAFERSRALNPKANVKTYILDP